jgi:hypothetical protein
MNRLTALFALPLFALAACSGGEAEKKADVPPVAVADERLPDGFTLYQGQQGAIEVQESSPPTGGKIITFSVNAPAEQIVRHYEREAEAAGLAYAGRLNAGEILSWEGRREGEGSPRTFGVTALRKSEYSNVTLMFDVTQ